MQVGKFLSRGHAKLGAVPHFDVEPRAGYLYVTLTSELEVGSAQASFRDLLAVAARHRQPKILIDCSRVHGEWTPADRHRREQPRRAKRRRMVSFPR